MSYTAAKGSVSDMETRRMAACLFNAKNMNSAVDWAAAAADFDSSPTASKAESFKTFIQRAIKKLGSYAKGKDKITDGELRRMAAAFLSTKDYNSAVDWAAAAADFGGKGKAESFRTFVQRARGKFEKLANGSVANGSMPSGTVTAAPAVAPVISNPKKGGRKRKAAEAEVADDGEEEGETMKLNKANRKMTKRSKLVEVKEEENDVKVGEQDVGVKEETIDEHAEEADVGTDAGTDAGEVYGDALGELDGMQENGPDDVQEDAVDEAQAAEPYEEPGTADDESDGSRKDSLADETAAEKDEVVDEQVLGDEIVGQVAEEYEEDAVAEPFIEAERVELETEVDADAEHEFLF
ncbi:hypothetical protein B0A48_14367 [Cryoendolithus antarcticus]|uniref:Uncharacterized protein n=1 Tax=Cryoendolithus antarcticus TaxID=1507870 RepID=A0A1V8SKC1_9PEZI|nr:hypothetical protein B0A48_14367 [Cryoendolithus antarcticus]